MASKRTGSPSKKSGSKTTSSRKSKAPTIGNAHAAVVEGTTFLEQMKRAEQQVKTVHVQKVTTFFRNPDGSVGEQSHVYPEDTERTSC